MSNIISDDAVVDSRYYQVATPGSLAEKLVAAARDRIYADFLKFARPEPDSEILDVGVSDVVGEAANVLERKYPHRNRITAVGLGSAVAFQAAFPSVRYQQIQAGEPLPFADQSFDIATSNAVLEHVGSPDAQVTFVRELARVARRAFISVPHRFFPVEHHTGIPFMHWWTPSYHAACSVLGKAEWTDPSNLILMTQNRLRQLCPANLSVKMGTTGINLGPFSSNLFLYIENS